MSSFSSLTFFSLLCLLSVLLSCAVQARPGLSLIDSTTVVFQPPNNWIRDKVLSARSLVLEDGTILVSNDVDPPPGQSVYFPVHASNDGGKTFHELSRVLDTQGHGGLRYESHLFLLNRPFGKFSASTIFLAGNAVPDDHKTSNLDLYASTDNGKTWTFVSTIATGGDAIPKNGYKAVWEPFIFQPSHGDTIYCYYSDQRDPKYGQKVVHVSTNDLFNWSPVVNDVTAINPGFRLGMPVVSEMANGEFFMSYEYFGPPAPPFAAYFKISKDPNSWNEIVGQMVKTSTGEVLLSSPYNVFTRAGGPQGTLVLNARSSSKLYINKNNGRGVWTALDTNAPASYSRGLMLARDPRFVMISGGGLGFDQNNDDRVTFTITRVA